MTGDKLKHGGGSRRVRISVELSGAQVGFLKALSAEIGRPVSEIVSEAVQCMSGFWMIDVKRELPLRILDRMQKGGYL